MVRINGLFHLLIKVYKSYNLLTNLLLTSNGTSQHQLPVAVGSPAGDVMSCGCERSDGYVLFDLRPGLFSGHVAREFSKKWGDGGLSWVFVSWKCVCVVKCFMRNSTMVKEVVVSNIFNFHPEILGNDPI